MILSFCQVLALLNIEAIFWIRSSMCNCDRYRLCTDGILVGWFLLVFGGHSTERLSYSVYKCLVLVLRGWARSKIQESLFTVEL